MMGDDFKLKIEGVCELDAIHSWGDGYGGSLSIEGTGTITVNADKLNEYAIALHAERSDSTLNFGKNVNLLKDWVLENLTKMEEKAREAELQKTREAGQQEKRELAALRQELTSRKETALQASREIDALQKSRQEFNEILGRLQEIRKKL